MEEKILKPVSVNERLPKQNIRLAHILSSDYVPMWYDGSLWFGCYRYDKNDWYILEGDSEDDTSLITHWFELTEPASPHSMPDVKRYDWFRTNVEMTEQKDGDYIKYSDYKLMRSQCDGLIKQKAVEFNNWTNDLNKCDYYPVYHPTTVKIKHWQNRSNDDDIKTTTELYEIFNQQER